MPGAACGTSCLMDRSEYQGRGGERQGKSAEAFSTQSNATSSKPRRFPPQPELAGRMRAAGFANVAWRDMTLGVVALHSGWRV